MRLPCNQSSGLFAASIGLTAGRTVFLRSRVVDARHPVARRENCAILRYAVRTLRRDAALTTFAIPIYSGLARTLGVVNALWLRPLPAKAIQHLLFGVDSSPGRRLERPSPLSRWSPVFRPCASDAGVAHRFPCRSAIWNKASRDIADAHLPRHSGIAAVRRRARPSWSTTRGAIVAALIAGTRVATRRRRKHGDRSNIGADVRRE